MGFDVVYLPPIHPIGTTFRKGPNNSLDAGPDDVGVRGRSAPPRAATTPSTRSWARWRTSPASSPAPGTWAWRSPSTSPSSAPRPPWVHKHPEWFHHRPDGSIAYAENPPKKYQDIYPIAFDADMDGLVAETCRILRHWMDTGVRIFRVDNPHTKPVVFWERVIADINGTDPDVIFLAEAFTRPAMMHTLAQIGFQQSYTYFTWRNTKQELTEYLTELTGRPPPTCGPTSSPTPPTSCTPTSSTAVARLRGPRRPRRHPLPTWGIYSGYELCENTPLREGSEEYLDSEKYQLKPRDWEAAEREGRTIAPLITRLNTIRRENPALRQLRDLPPHGQGGGHRLLEAAGQHVVLVVANLDPRHTQEATVSLDMPQLGLDWHESVPVRDELTGETYQWGSANYVRPERGPGACPARPSDRPPHSESEGQERHERQRTRPGHLRRHTPPRTGTPTGSNAPSSTRSSSAPSRTATGTASVTSRV